MLVYAHGIVAIITTLATPHIYTLSLHDALPIFVGQLGNSGRLAEARILRVVADRQDKIAVRGGKRLVGDDIGMRIANALRRSEEHTSELQSQSNLVCRLLIEKKNQKIRTHTHSP